MTLARYGRAVRDRWMAVLLLTIIGGAAAGAYSFLQTPLYTAEIQLFVSTRSSDVDTSQLNQGGIFTQQRVKSYADIVNSPTVTTAVIERLGLHESPDELSSEIVAATPLDTVLLNISVTDRSPERARDIASAISIEFPKLVDRIETPPGQASSPVKVSITRSASLPKDPVVPRKKLNVTVGITLGFVLGLALAIVLNAVDRTLRSSAEVTRISGAPLLGEIENDSSIKDVTLPAAEIPNRSSESFRRLRTNVRFLSVDERLDSFVVTGALPGDGKTTTAANLAIALARSGETVVLIDGDLRRPAIADLFSLPSGVGLTSVLLGEVSPTNALQQWVDELPLYIMTSGPTPPNPSELLGSMRLNDLIEGFGARGMTVIIDSPPLLPVTDAAVIGRATKGALLVTRIGSTRSDQLLDSTEALSKAGVPLLGVVANRVPVKGRAGAPYSGYYGAAPRQSVRSDTRTS